MVRIEEVGARRGPPGTRKAKLAVAVLALAAIVALAGAVMTSPSAGPVGKAKDATSTAAGAVVDGMETRGDLIAR